MSTFLRKWKYEGKAASAWYVHVIEGAIEVRKRAPKGSRSKDADEYEHKLRVAIRDGNWCVPCVEFKSECQCTIAPVARTQTVEEFAAVWQERNKRECAHGTVLFYGECLKHIKSQFSGVSIGSVTFAQIETFKVYLSGAANLSTTTANNVLRSLRALLEYAARMGKFGDGARAPRVDMFPKVKHAGKFLTENQTKIALAWVKANAPQWAYMFEVMLATGLRIGEVIALEWRDVDLKGSILHVNRVFYRGKFDPAGSAQRSIPLEASALAALSGVVRRLDNPFVFPGGKHKHLTTPSVRWVFQALTEHMRTLKGEEGTGVHKGVEPLKAVHNITPHVLRHTFATRKVGEGVPLKVLSVLMGHASVTTTEIYAKVTDDALRAAMGQKVSNK